jgi:hypothetical protein
MVVVRSWLDSSSSTTSISSSTMLHLVFKFLLFFPSPPSFPFACLVREVGPDTL